MITIPYYQRPVHRNTKNNFFNFSSNFSNAVSFNRIYSDSNNVDIEETQFDNFNMNTFNYGISSYIGYKSTSFYVKYDLNPLFKDTETRNISMGIRLDLN